MEFQSFILVSIEKIGSSSGKNSNTIETTVKVKSYRRFLNDPHNGQIARISYIFLEFPNSLTLSREEGIRTLDTLLAYTHFPGVRLRPLGHLSNLLRNNKKNRSP